MEQTRAVNALAPFVALSKSATSARAAADLVAQATSAPNAYVFGELLQTPAIQALRSDAQYQSHYALLELFAWGTWAEYQGELAAAAAAAAAALPAAPTDALAAAGSTLPTLSPVQQHKMRLLSLLTLAANTSPAAPLTYAHLQSALSLDSPLALERLVTQAIYANLLSASLNPAQGTVAINSVAPLRDLSPGSVPRLAADLGAWSARCEGVLADLEKQMRAVRDEAQRRAADSRLRDDQLRAAESTSDKAKKDDGDDAMELDDGSSNARPSRKRGTGGMGFRKK